MASIESIVSQWLGKLESITDEMKNNISSFFWLFFNAINANINSPGVLVKVAEAWRQNINLVFHFNKCLIFCWTLPCNLTICLLSTSIWSISVIICRVKDVSDTVKANVNAHILSVSLLISTEYDRNLLLEMDISLTYDGAEDSLMRNFVFYIKFPKQFQSHINNSLHVHYMKFQMKFPMKYWIWKFHMNYHFTMNSGEIS